VSSCGAFAWKMHSGCPYISSCVSAQLQSASQRFEAGN
jgi:hypothetical protein